MTRLNILISEKAPESTFQHTEGLLNKLGLDFQVAADGYSFNYSAQLPEDRISLVEQEVQPLIATDMQGLVSLSLQT